MKSITRATIDRSGNHYCGPLILAAIIGCTTAEAAAEVRKHNPWITVVKGLTDRALWTTLRAHGFSALTIPVKKVERVRKLSALQAFYFGAFEQGEEQRTTVGPTLAQWLKLDRNMERFYIVEVTGHWILVRGRKIIDTMTRGEWIFTSRYPHRRSRVVNVRMVVPPARI